AFAISEIARWVDKTGSFAGMLDGVAEAGLSTAELVEFYEGIRDHSGRLELEWRPEFEATFPEAVAMLPLVRHAGFVLYWERTLFEAMVEGDEPTVGQALAAFRQRGIGLDGLRRLAPVSVQHRRPLWWGDGNVPDVGLTILQVAEQLASPEVQRRL